MLRPCNLARLLAAAALAVPLAAVADPRYTVTAVAGADSVASDLNSLGQVVGTMASAGAYHAFLYSGGLTDIGTLGGQYSNATAINDDGVVVGNAQINSDFSYHGFTYIGGVLQALPGAADTQANGINNAGTIVGQRVVGTADGDQTHAYAYAGGTYTDLGTLPIGDASRALAVNGHGDVVGAAANMINGAPNFPEDPFLYRNGTMTSLGNFGGIFSAATSINDHGQIVGYSGIPGSIGPDIYPRNAFLYENGVLHNLGGFGANVSSSAADINNLGQIVGAGSVASGDAHAFLYENGELLDLNALIDPAGGWVIRDAAAINDLQQIAATACKDAACYAVRLDLVPAVPEPSTCAMLAAGLALGWGRRIRALKRLA
jgi:probable HAF family extracellular repeat protein